MSDIVHISEDRRISLKSLSEILGGNGESVVSYELFEKLEGPLELSIYKILGKPNFDNQELKDFWEEQRLDSSPMLLAGRIPGGEQSGVEQPRRDAEGIGLELYVTLRAVEELAWD